MTVEPRVCVIIPCYNEEKFLGDTLMTLQQQTMRDFVCLIGDNASTDRSPEIIQDVARADSRFVHVRHDRNLGALGNWKQLLARVEQDYSSEYLFNFASHDLVSLTYLDRTLQQLDDNPQATMASGRMAGFLDSLAGAQILDGAVYDFFKRPGLLTFLESAANLANCTIINSVWRLSALRKSRVLANLVPMRGPDHLIISWMASLGPVLIDSSTTYFRRFFRTDDSMSAQLERVAGHGGLDHDLLHRRFVLHYLDLFDERFPDLDRKEADHFRQFLFNSLFSRFPYNVI